jgi:hypothetical protein
LFCQPVLCGHPIIHSFVRQYKMDSGATYLLLTTPQFLYHTSFLLQSDFAVKELCLSTHLHPSIPLRITNSGETRNRQSITMVNSTQLDGIALVVGVSISLLPPTVPPSTVDFMRHSPAAASGETAHFRSSRLEPKPLFSLILTKRPPKPPQKRASSMPLTKGTKLRHSK